MRAIEIVHWSLAGVNSSVSDGQMPSDKITNGGEEAFNNLFSETGSSFHPEPLISGKGRAVNNFAQDRRSRVGTNKKADNCIGFQDFCVQCMWWSSSLLERLATACGKH